MRFFVAPSVDEPLALFRFDDAGGSPEALRGGRWVVWPEALRFTMEGDMGADEVDEDTARAVANDLVGTPAR